MKDNRQEKLEKDLKHWHAMYTRTRKRKFISRALRETLLSTCCYYIGLCEGQLKRFKK